MNARTSASRTLTIAVIVSFFASTVFAQKPYARIQITTNDEDGLVAVNESVTFTATIKNTTDQTLSGKILWTVHTVAFQRPKPRESGITITTGQTVTREHALAMPTRGFADVECRLTIDGKEETISRRSRIGAEPERVSSELTKEDDFDIFWEHSLAELANAKSDFKLDAKPRQAKEGVDLFEVSMRSFGNIRVRGWLEVPHKPGPHPVVIRVPGYGGNMKPIGRRDMIVFSFNPRGHGNSQQDVSARPRNYWVRGLDDKNKYFYRGAYLDCVRAVDFVCSRSDVDQDCIAIWGGSQGGAFAFATAALDSRIDLCVANIPFLCDWHNYFKLTKWPEMNEWIEEREDRSWDSTLRTMSYFDTLNLCGRIKCPTIMGIGLQDQVCPPTTSFAAFNRIPGRKTYRVYVNRGHGMDDEHWLWVWKQIESEFRSTNK